jgi:hypothetical protein
MGTPCDRGRQILLAASCYCMSVGNGAKNLRCMCYSSVLPAGAKVDLQASNADGHQHDSFLPKRPSILGLVGLMRKAGFIVSETVLDHEPFTACGALCRPPAHRQLSQGSVWVGSSSGKDG